MDRTAFAISSAFFIGGAVVFVWGMFKDRQRAASLVREKVKLQAYSAKVVGSSNWSETHVSGSSSGGGGYVGPYGGHISAPSVNVSSNVVNKHQFFLIYDNGFEVPVTIDNLNFSTRDGQTADTIWLSDGKLEELVFVYVREIKQYLHYGNKMRAAARRMWPFYRGMLIYAFFPIIGLALAAPWAVIAAEAVERRDRELGIAFLIMGFTIGCVISFFRYTVRISSLQKEISKSVDAIYAQIKNGRT